MTDRMDGRYFGGDARGQVDIELGVEVSERSVSWRVAPIAGNDSESIDSDSREVQRHIRQLRAAIQRANNRNRPVQSFFKDRRRRKQQSEPVPCPACKGVNAFDCEHCGGSGLVPA